MTLSTVLRVGLENAAAATALALLAGVAGRTLRRRPALRHALWMLVLLKLVTPPIHAVPLPEFPVRVAAVTEPAPAPLPFVEPVPPAAVLVGPAEAFAFEMVTRDEPPEPADLDRGFEAEPAAVPEATAAVVPPVKVVVDWASFVVSSAAAVWVTGSVLTLLLAAVRIGQFRRGVRDAGPADGATTELVAAVADRLGLRRRPEARVIDLTLPPVVLGWGGRPLLLLPREFWDRLGGRPRELLLAHELAHLRRGDHWVRLFELAVTAAYWWLPAVWWARQGLRAAEEECCDAWAVWAYPGSSRAYAETLVDAVDFLSRRPTPVPALASGFGPVSHLRRRLVMIMRGKTSKGLGLGGVVAALALSAALLPFRPSWAEPPAADPGSALPVQVEPAPAPPEPPQPPAAPAPPEPPQPPAAPAPPEPPQLPSAPPTPPMPPKPSLPPLPPNAPEIGAVYYQNLPQLAWQMRYIRAWEETDDEQAEAMRKLTAALEAVVAADRSAKAAGGKPSPAFREKLLKLAEEAKHAAGEPPAEEAKTTAPGVNQPMPTPSAAAAPAPGVIQPMPTPSAAAAPKRPAWTGSYTATRPVLTDADREKLHEEMKALAAEASRRGAEMWKAGQKLAETQRRLYDIEHRLLGGQIKSPKTTNRAAVSIPDPGQDRRSSVQPGGMTQFDGNNDFTSPAPAAKPDQEKRLSEVEKKLDKVLKALESLQKKDKDENEDPSKAGGTRS